MNEFNKNQTQETYDFLYKENAFKITLHMIQSTLRISIEAISQCILFKTEISDGETHEMREACPRVLGFIFISFSLASFDNDTKSR